MSRKSWVVVGWVLVVGAVLCGLLTVPVWNVRGSTRGGSATVESTPLHTTVVGDGLFTHEAFWSVSWPTAVACGLVLVGGVWLVRRHRVGGVTGVPRSASPSR